MQFISKAGSLSFTESMQSYLIEKVDKLSKYVSDVDGKAVLSKEGVKVKLEISLPGNIRASRSGMDYYSLVIDVVEQLESQIRKFKAITKNRRKHQNLKHDYEELDSFLGDVQRYDVREKLIIKQEMTQDEAIENMELLGHTFFAYEDIEHRTTCVVYKRHDGGYGCLVIK
jgi:putative sigma-54 modulation protein